MKFYTTRTASNTLTYYTEKEIILSKIKIKEKLIYTSF